MKNFKALFQSNISLIIWYLVSNFLRRILTCTKQMYLLKRDSGRFKSKCRRAYRCWSSRWCWCCTPSTLSIFGQEKRTAPLQQLFLKISQSHFDWIHWKITAGPEPFDFFWPKIDRVPGEGYDTPWCSTKHQVPLVSKHAKTDLRNLRISGCLRFLVVRVPNLYFGSTIQYNTVGEPD